MEELEELYSAKRVKDILGIGESTYRTTLRDYKKYISKRKAAKNKDLFTLQGLEIFGTIVKLKKLGYKQAEIVSEIKKSPQYYESRVKDKVLNENEDIKTIMTSTDVPELIEEFVSRMSRTNNELNSLRKTLDKRTENYKQEISILQDKLVSNEENTSKSITSLCKTIWKLEEEIKELRNESLFTRFKKLFKF